MKEAVIRMETTARPTTDRSASPRLLKGLLLAITLVALLATTVILCQQDIENPSYVYMILDETGMQIIDGRPDGDRTTGLLDIRADNSSRDAQLLLVKGQQVQVADAQGATYLVTTRRETVDNLLRRSDVTVGDGEMVVVDTTGETPTVSVMAEYSQTRDVTVTTPYKTERVVNHMLAKGTEQVVQEGVPGTVVETYKDTYRDGKLVSTELVSTTEDNAVTEIVEYGTMVSSVERSDYMVDVTTFDDGTGYLLFASGDTMAFSSVYGSCESTAYSIHGWTASGRPTAYGNIAVDTSVFPFGTRFYILTNDGYLEYGMAVASDTGSAIKGTKLDLWFDSYDDACSFGRRYCTVYVLTEALQKKNPRFLYGKRGFFV